MHRYDLTTGGDKYWVFIQLFINIKNETLNGTNVIQRWWKVSQNTSLSREKMNSIDAFLMLYASVYFLCHTKKIWINFAF